MLLNPRMHPGRRLLLWGLVPVGTLLADPIVIAPLPAGHMKVELRQIVRAEAGTFTPPKVLLDQPKDSPSEMLELDRMVVRGKYNPPPPPPREPGVDRFFRTGTFFETDRTRLWTGPGSRGLAELKFTFKF